MSFWDEIWGTKQNISEDDLKITQIRLPSKEEVVEGKEYIPPTAQHWYENGDNYWTDNCVEDNKVMIANDTGINDFALAWQEQSVRPVAVIDNIQALGLDKGDKLEIGGQKWTIIGNNTAICDKSIGKSTFNGENSLAYGITSAFVGDVFEQLSEGKYVYRSNYKGSDAEKYIQDWIKDNDIEVQSPGFLRGDNLTKEDAKKMFSESEAETNFKLAMK